MGSFDSEVPYGTLDLMVLNTLAGMGPLHGFGIARRIEQIADGAFALNRAPSTRPSCGSSRRGGCERVGHERAQPAWPLLLDHAGGPPAARGRGGKLGANRRHRQSHARGGVMTRIRVFLSRALDLVLRRRRDQRLSEEIETHLDLLAAEQMSARAERRGGAARGAAGLRRRRARQGTVPGPAGTAARRHHAAGSAAGDPTVVARTGLRILAPLPSSDSALASTTCSSRS